MIMNLRAILTRISIGKAPTFNLATNFSNKGLEYFNSQDYLNAA